MNVLILGRGKTGSLVAEVARARGHKVESLGSAENQNAAALTPPFLGRFDGVLDFTAPDAVVPNIEACVNAGRSIVVGTTGWHDHLPAVQELVMRGGTGLVYGTNFSIGVNLFLEVARTAAAAFQHGYKGQIFERHHAEKKDAPSGTALTIQGVIKEASDHEVEIVSFREGDVVGMHEVILDSANDDIYLSHNAKSRRGFAEGAIRAIDWLRGRKGVFAFHEIWRDV